MKNILKKISELAIEQNESAFSDRHIELKWLGDTGASMEEILQAQTKLNVAFPEDYLKFLLLTNGFFTPCDSTEPTFETVDKIDYLKNVDSFLLELWNEGPLINIGEQLNRAIVVGGLNDEQYFLLIAPVEPDDKWQYWKFASWLPGELPYENLEAYFGSVLTFLERDKKSSSQI